MARGAWKFSFRCFCGWIDSAFGGFLNWSAVLHLHHAFSWQSILVREDCRTGLLRVKVYIQCGLIVSEEGIIESKLERSSYSVGECPLVNHGEWTPGVEFFF